MVNPHSVPEPSVLKPPFAEPRLLLLWEMGMPQKWPSMTSAVEEVYFSKATGF